MSNGINNWKLEQEDNIEPVEFENKLNQVFDLFSEQKEEISKLQF